LTAERVEARNFATSIDLGAKKLAAVAQPSISTSCTCNTPGRAI
jgi:hypothetical protein